MYRITELKNEIDFYLRQTGDEERSTAIGHLYGVSDLCVVLSLRRGADIAVCAAGGLLHDLWIYTNGDSANHAHHSSKLAKKILEDMRLFDDKEISVICEAIKNHSNKGEEHDLYSEILKDADIVHRYLSDPDIRFTKSKAQRIKNSLRELGINIKVKKK